MVKSIYLFITLILGVNCWDLTILSPVLNNKTNPLWAVAWALLGFYWFRRSPDNHKKIFKKYLVYFYLLAAGFLLSTLPAYVFWDQDFITSLVVNRHLIWYLFLPLILYIQPTANEIINALVFYTVAYMTIWIIQATIPYPLTTFFESKIELGRGGFELEETEFGHLLPGYSIMLLLLYFKMQQFTENVKFKTLIPLAIMLTIFFILQNRGALFFALIVTGYGIFHLHSKYKPFIIISLVLIGLETYLVTENYWSSFINETTLQLNDPDYNRWKAFYYFAFDYSPHWICNILGNGYLSSKIKSGELIQDMMTQGYFQSDIGIIGLWSVYGILPLIVIYSVIFKIVFRKLYPFYLKAMALHILFVPIAWSFARDDFMILIVLLYLFAYYKNKSYLFIPQKFPIYSRTLSITLL